MENKYYNENYYNANTILKFLRKVLNEINKSYVDSGMRTAFLLKRYIEKYKIDAELAHQHVLLCMLKDIGLFYMDGAVPSNDPALAAASSYAFLHQCSPLGAAARPLLFYKAKYMEDVNNPDYDMGLLMTLLYQVSLFIYQRKDIEEIEEILKEERRKKHVNPDQVKKVIRLLKDHPDIIEKLNSESELYVYETSKYISLADYGTDTLGDFLDTTSFMFEFHNHETMAHTVTTAQIAYDLAINCKLTESTARAIEIAGKVHDIGKIRVPLEILCFPGKLEGEALAEMQNHAKYTKEIIEGCFSYVIVEIASRHHEKLDGSGYPLGITKKDLTSADKVLAVADICSALYCKRSYKAAFTPEKIQSILLSDAKAGKLDERIVNHLIDDYDKIMNNAKIVEDSALKKYNTMKDEYEALAKSPALRHVFGESEDVDLERPESTAADETEEYISDVIKYDKKKEPEVVEQIIYVDENGNEIDYNPEEDNAYIEEGEAIFIPEEEKQVDPLEEYNQAEMGDVPIEEIEEEDEEEIEEKEEEPPVFDLNPKEEAIEEQKEDDEFDAFLNSIPEIEEKDDPFKEEPKKKVFVPKAPLKNPMMDFDPFKEEIDPVFNEPILPKEETKEEIDDEFDAFLNSIPEIEEKDDPFKEQQEEALPEEVEEADSTSEEEEPVFELDSEEAIEEIEEPAEEEAVEAEEEPVFELDSEEALEEIEEPATEEADAIEEEEEPTEEEALPEANEESLEETEEEADEAKEEVAEEVIEEVAEEPTEEAPVEESIEEAIEENDNIDEAIDSKYEEDPDEEVDDFTIEDEEEESTLDEESIQEEKEDDYVTSYVDEDEFDEEEEPKDEEDSYITPDESKYDQDPNEEIDDSTGEEEEDAYVTSYVDEEEIEESKEEKEDDYVTSYVDEDEFDEPLEEEAIEEPAKEEPKEEAPIEEPSEEANALEEEVDSTEPDFEFKEEKPKKKKSKPSRDEDEDDEEDDEDDDEDDDDDEEDEDEEEEEDDSDEEDEPKDTKHKKFFSNDIYRKMFTYNPNNKKKK